MRTDPIHTGCVGDIQDGEAIQLQMVYVPRRPNLVSKWNWKSIEGKAIRLEGFCDWNDDLHRDL